MALSKIDAANFLTGTIPQGNVANASLGAVTALPGAIATGKVLQVVNTEFQTSFTTTSSSAVDTGIAVSITPSATNSRILLETNIPQRTEENVYVSFYIYRQINGGGYSELDRLDQSNHYYLNNDFQTIYYGKKIDTTHNTTNQIDYKIYTHIQGGGSGVTLCPDGVVN